MEGLFLYRATLLRREPALTLRNVRKRVEAFLDRQTFNSPSLCRSATNIGHRNRKSEICGADLRLRFGMEENMKSVYQMTNEELLRMMKVTENGLDESKAEEILKEKGPNMLQEGRKRVYGRCF